jgi:hypothetical protein
LYKEWCNRFNKTPHNLKTILEIPYLPISFFKTHKIASSNLRIKKIFRSSGTTSGKRSEHHIQDLDIYERIAIKTFENFFDTLENFYFLALLPNYLEQDDSSLVYMINLFMRKSANYFDGFYLNDWKGLLNIIDELSQKNDKKIILWGVTYALLDFSENFSIKLNDNFLVFETGGMKGRKKECIREEVHERLKKNFGLKKIYSEYGMTELLSQAYITPLDNCFKTAFTLKVLIREHNDPMAVSLNGRGLINIIDLANIDTCSFIATDDVGLLYDDGSFEVIGRSDGSEIRGCNLLWSV